MHCHKTGLGAQCAHLETRSRAQCLGRGRCCAHGRLVVRMSRAQPAQVARLLGARWSRHAQAACPRSRPQNSRSRHQLTHNRRPRSRHQSPGRDLLETTLCHDINFMSRPRFYPQWDFQVATPKLQVATSPTATHVATSKMMSRPQIRSAPSLLHRDSLFPCRDLPSAQPK